ncbi:MAG: dihydroorotate dehydrogenase electron transfer subunit, partial [Lachnospiraceae bacterium]|nr:dihydroorotate dehydrogenase electron transfer subunit [Lachnospiraceae bacterium]
MKKKEKARVIKNERLAEDIYSLWIEAELADSVVPGQFVMVYPKTETRLLGRPISVCERKQGSLRLVFRTVGGGTREFASYREGDSIDLMGPLGNGFPIEEGKALLIGGGIGIPPLLGLAQARKKEDNLIVAGYRTEDTYLTGELSQAGLLYTAIESLPDKESEKASVDRTSVAVPSETAGDPASGLR